MKTEALRFCIQAQHGKEDYAEARLELTALETELARLTASHAMQGESLVVLPRWMVSNMEDKLKEQAKYIEWANAKIEELERVK